MFDKWTIRTRIALAIVGTSTALLLAMAAVVYFSFSRQLNVNLDDVLTLRSASNSQLVDSTTVPPRLTVDSDPGGERSEGEAVLRLFDANATLLADESPAARTTDEEARLVQAAVASDRDVFRTIDLGGDEDYRVVASPVRNEGVVTGVLVTGIERSQVNEPLAILRLILAIAVPSTIVAIGIGGFAIARSALRPVATITSTAREIAAGDVERRIEGISTHDEIGELASTLNDMLARLAETMERERRFTADASHELRTPLSAIETSIDVTLSQDRNVSEYRHTLTAVQEQTHRLASLTRQLLLLSRLDSDTIRREFDPIDFDDLVEAIASTFADAHPGIDLSVDIQASPLHIDGNIELLARAVMNLLENSVTHGGPSVHVRLVVSREEAPPERSSGSSTTVRGYQRNWPRKYFSGSAAAMPRAPAVVADLGWQSLPGSSHCMQVLFGWCNRLPAARNSKSRFPEKRRVKKLNPPSSGPQLPL